MARRRGSFLGGHQILYGGQFGPETTTSIEKRRYKPFSNERPLRASEKSPSPTPKVVLKPVDERAPAWKSAKNRTSPSKITRKEEELVHELARILADTTAEVLQIPSSDLQKCKEWRQVALDWRERFGNNRKYIKSNWPRILQNRLEARANNAWEALTEEVAILWGAPAFSKRVADVTLARRHKKFFGPKTQFKHRDILPDLPEAVKIIFAEASGLSPDTIHQLRAVTEALTKAERLPKIDQYWLINSGKQSLRALVEEAISSGKEPNSCTHYENLRFILEVPIIQRRLGDRVRQSRKFLITDS